MLALRIAAALSATALFTTPALAQTIEAPAAEAPAAAAPVVAQGDTIETLRASGRFKILLKAFDRTNLTEVIKAQTALTVFAPTDAAFTALPPAQLQALTEDAPALQTLLIYHLINAPIESAMLVGARGPVATVSGKGLLLDGSGAGLMANDAHVVQADIHTTSGIVHVVDKVLTPETAEALLAARPAAAPAP